MKLTNIKNIKIKKNIIKIMAGRMYLRKLLNKRIKSINGNQNMKIINWNKGSMNITKKMVEIKEIIRKDKPLVLFISELNFDRTTHPSDLYIQNYNF